MSRLHCIMSSLLRLHSFSLLHFHKGACCLGDVWLSRLPQPFSAAQLHPREMSAFKAWPACHCGHMEGTFRRFPGGLHSPLPHWGVLIDVNVLPSTQRTWKAHCGLFFFFFCHWELQQFKTLKPTLVCRSPNCLRVYFREMQRSLDCKFFD